LVANLKGHVEDTCGILLLRNCQQGYNDPVSNQRSPLEVQADQWRQLNNLQIIFSEQVEAKKDLSV
jgi:hypothetical protein